MTCKIVTYWDGVRAILREPKRFPAEVSTRAQLEAADRLEAMERALSAIAERGIEQRPRPIADYKAKALGCQTCKHWWDYGEPEHHSESCAYVIARNALAAPQ